MGNVLKTRANKQKPMARMMNVGDQPEKRPVKSPIYKMHMKKEEEEEETIEGGNGEEDEEEEEQC